MLSELPVELITMGASAIGGFFMRQQAESRKDRHAEHMQALARHGAAETSRHRAASNGGKWIRRFLVASIVFAVILAPFAIAVFTDQATIVQYAEKARAPLWGLLGPSSPQTRFVSIDGYLLTPETRQGLLAVIAFYFGQGAAK